MAKPTELTFTLWACAILGTLLVFLMRLISILPASKGHTSTLNGDLKVPKDTNIMILLGSGGHTGEMLRILEQWGEAVNDYKAHYIISSGDNTSLLKLKEFNKPNHYHLSVVHRARSIGQGKIAATYNTLKAFASSIGIIINTINSPPKVFLTNGPGTAIPIAYTLFVLKFIGICSTKIIYVESLARVQQLSLTGLMILPISNRIIVQWPQLAQRYPRCEYHGILV